MPVNPKSENGLTMYLPGNYRNPSSIRRFSRVDYMLALQRLIVTD